MLLSSTGPADTHGGGSRDLRGVGVWRGVQIDGGRKCGGEGRGLKLTSRTTPLQVSSLPFLEFFSQHTTSAFDRFVLRCAATARAILSEEQKGAIFTLLLDFRNVIIVCARGADGGSPRKS